MIEPVRALLPGGTPISGVLAAPDRTPAPGVVVLHEITGIDRAIKDACLRLADSGYVAFAPDLYSHGRRLVCLSRVLVDMTSGHMERPHQEKECDRENEDPQLLVRPHN